MLFVQCKTIAQYFTFRSDGFLLEDISDDSLQYLSDDVRDMIRMAKDPHDERVVDIWERAGAQVH